MTKINIDAFNDTDKEIVLNEIIPQIDSTLSTNAIVDVFIYDTTKDDDDGAWTETSTYQSWYHETLNTVNRGATKAFPKLALIVVEALYIYIYDLSDKDCPMWMRFQKGGAFVSWTDNTLNMIVDTSSSLTVCRAKNGVFYIGASSSYYEVDFINDSGNFISSGSLKLYGGNISGRNGGLGYEIDLVGRDPIINSAINDIDVVSVGNMKNLVALATGGVGTGGTSIIHPNGNVADIPNHTNPATVTIVEFLEGGKYIATNTNWSVLHIYETPYEDIAQADYLARYWTSDAVDPGQVKSIGSHRDLRENYLTGNGGINRFSDLLDPVDGMVSYTTHLYHTGWLKGDIRRALLANSKTEERSVKTATIIENGTITESAVATGSDLMGYGGWSTTNYLSEAYNADLDYGTGDFYLTAWVKNTGVSGCLFANGTVWNTGKLSILSLSTKIIRVSIYPNIIDTAVVFELGVWNLITVTRKSGIVYIYVNDNLVHREANANSIGRSEALTIGVDGDLTSTPFTTGSISLWRTGAGHIETEQVKRTYNDEKILFQENNKCLIDGTSSDVLCQDLDEITGELTLATTDGISTFQGLRRINEDATHTSKTSLSAHNSIIADGI